MKASLSCNAKRAFPLRETPLFCMGLLLHRTIRFVKCFWLNFPPKNHPSNALSLVYFYKSPYRPWYYSPILPRFSLYSVCVSQHLYSVSVLQHRRFTPACFCLFPLHRPEQSPEKAPLQPSIPQKQDRLWTKTYHNIP